MGVLLEKEWPRSNPMKKLIEILFQQQKKNIKLTKKQNDLLAELLHRAAPLDKESLKRSVMDNTDLKDLFKVANTKFFSIKKYFKTYQLDKTDYYLTDEVLKTIREHEKNDS